MTLLTKIFAELAEGTPNRLHLPEHRQIEIYSRRNSLDVAEDKSQLPLAHLAGIVRSFTLLDRYLSAKMGFCEPVESWPFYLGLPRVSGVDKIIAQIYRILRLARLVLLHPMSRIETRDGLVMINGVIGPNAFSIELSANGIILLESAVAYYLKSESGPYSQAYVEAMLGEYYVDILAEIKRYSDEGRSLYQFRRAEPFSRHFRLDCSNAKVQQLEGEYEFEIVPLYKDKARYPIDFFVVIDKWMHIVPVEALKNNRIKAEDLVKWRAENLDGVRLPEDFRMRFCNDAVVINQPMT